MEKLITEQILKQLRLIKYDRSKSLLEQSEIPSDYLGDTGSFEKQIQKKELPKTGKESLEDKTMGRYIEKGEFEKRLCDTPSILMWDTDDEKYYYHKPSEFCKSFGGTELIYVDTNYLLSPVNMAEPRYRCACKQNGEILVPTPDGGKTMKVNNFIISNESVGGKTGTAIYDWFHDMHNFLMVGSLTLTLFGGPVGAALAIGLDIADSALYLEEGDPWMAGLMFMMAVVPFGKLMKLVGGKSWAKGLTKEIYEKILKKLKLKKELTEAEKNIVEALSKAELRNKAFWRLIKGKLNVAIKKYDIFYFVRAIIYLVDKGLLLSSFLIKFGLVIAGVWWSWSQLADILGITKGDDDIIKKQMSESEMLKLSLINLVQTAINKNFVYSEKYKDVNQPIVGLFQILLQGYGNEPHIVKGESSSNNMINLYNTSKIKEIKAYNVAGKEVAKVLNNDKKNNLSLKLPSKGVYIFMSNYFDGSKGKGKFIFDPASKGIYSKFEIISDSLEKNFKWGYYTPKTTSAVSEFQKEKNLPSDGVIGSETMKKLLLTLRNKNADTLLKELTLWGIDFSNLSETKIIEKVPTKEEIMSAYEKQKTQVSDSLNVAYEMKYIKIKEKADSLSAIGEGLSIIIPEK